jgi:hypothetical protein
VKPGDVLTCGRCGAHSLPLHTTGGRAFEQGGGLICTWPGGTLDTGIHAAVFGSAPTPEVCLPCRHRELAGAPPAAPGSGALLPSPLPLAAGAGTDPRPEDPPASPPPAPSTSEVRSSSPRAQLGLFA